MCCLSCHGFPFFSEREVLVCVFTGRAVMFSDTDTAVCMAGRYGENMQCVMYVCPATLMVEVMDITEKGFCGLKAGAENIL